MEGRFCTCDQYEISPPSLTSLRVCGNLTTCGPHTVRQITSPTPTTDRVCRAENVTTTIQSDVPSAQLSLFTAINNWIVISPAYPASTPAQHHQPHHHRRDEHEHHAAAQKQADGHQAGELQQRNDLGGHGCAALGRRRRLLARASPLQRSADRPLRRTAGPGRPMTHPLPRVRRRTQPQNSARQRSRTTDPRGVSTRPSDGQRPQRWP